MEEPWCECIAAMPALPEMMPNSILSDSLREEWEDQPGWWGEACEHTWNETCIDPEAKVRTRPCASADRALLALAGEAQRAEVQGRREPREGPR